MARTRCYKCKQFASFENTQPAVNGIAGRVHKMGLGCKKNAVQVVKVAPKVKPPVVSFAELEDFAQGIVWLSSGLKWEPRSKTPTAVVQPPTRVPLEWKPRQVPAASHIA